MVRSYIIVCIGSVWSLFIGTFNYCQTTNSCLSKSSLKAISGLVKMEDKLLDRIKLKAFADEKLSIAVTRISLIYRVENTMGKGENAGYQHFLLSPKCFPKPPSYGLLKVGIVRKRVKQNLNDSHACTFKFFSLLV